MDEIAPRVAFASSRTVVEGMLDSVLERLCFDSITIVHRESTHLSAPEILRLSFGGDSTQMLVGLLAIDIHEL